MQLEVEEDLQALIVHGVDNLGTTCIVKGHANLDPGGVATEKVGELQGALATAVEGDNDTVGRR